MSASVPIHEAVGAALRFVRGNLRFVATVAAIGAGVVTVLSALALFVTPVSLLASVGATIARAFIYAALIGAALAGAAGARDRLLADGWRVWAAMAIVGFFMFIVMMVLLIPGFIVLIAGPMAPFTSELERAGQDEAAVLAVMTRFLEQNPLAILLFVLFYGVVWLLLTSRLYLAAPASADAGRILSFETWGWTKGSTLRITAARLMLLGPAYVLVSALDYIAGALIGLNPLDPMAAAGLARANPLAFLGYIYATTFITVAVYASLEAGLSSYLYRGLRPPAQPVA